MTVTVTLVDHGVPYDPLAQRGLDRVEAGNEALGVFMMKKLMDDVRYEYRDGRNILTLKKKL